jgi:single-strand DNA-binding protein
MINNVVLVGRLTRDPMVRKTAAGRSVLSFTLAVDRRRGSNQDPNQPTADFISCVAWNQVADLMAQYTHKGSQIGIQGRIQTRNYDDPNTPGKKVYVTEVVCDSLTFLDSKNSDNRPADNSGYYPDDSSYDDTMDTTPTLNISSDDLPF